MSKSKKNLDLSIKREATAFVGDQLVDLCTAYAAQETSSEVCRFAATYLSESLLSKYVDEKTDPADVRRHRAIVKWLGVERLNQRTNLRLFSTDPQFTGMGSGHQILIKAARLIERTLGPKPPEDLLSRGSFSGGATTSVKRGVGTLAKKFSGTRDVTPRAWEVLKPHLSEFEAWTTYSAEVLKPRLVKGNVLFTVPKTALIDRVACKEPDYNIFAQKAVGDFIRGRLRRKARIDLNDQSVNRRLACEGSKTGKLATIDLSSASDSLTTGLVSLLLPHEWFKLLDALRCDKTFIDGLSHENAMFSSMGNGFTFELESLIFWALAHTIRGVTRAYGKISVYGDDIIVPASCAGALIQFLFWVGFRTNVKKTFIRGPFRESCGGHYYGGFDVTPFYLRRPIKDVSDLILFLNQFRQWLINTSMDAADNGWESPNCFVQLWLNLADLVPRILWGGCDLSSRVQLVSPGRAQCELIPLNRRHLSLEAELQVELYLSRLASHASPQRPVKGIPEVGPNELPDGELGVDDASKEQLVYSPVTSPLANDFVRETAPMSLVTTKGYGIRRAGKLAWVFGLVKPLLIHEQQ